MFLPFVAALLVAVAPPPPIVQKPIPFGPARRAETAAYAKRHYGLATYKLQGPHVIVEHYTATDSFDSSSDSLWTSDTSVDLNAVVDSDASAILDGVDFAG